MYPSPVALARVNATVIAVTYCDAMALLHEDFTQVIALYPVGEFRACADKVYREAGKTADDVHVVELHDCFS